jgi:hypothetical protein
VHPPSSTQPFVVTGYENLLMQQEKVLLMVAKPHVEEVQPVSSKIARATEAANIELRPHSAQEEDMAQRLKRRPPGLLNVFGDTLVLTEMRLLVVKGGKLAYWAVVDHNYTRQVLNETEARNDEAWKNFGEKGFLHKMTHSLHEYGWIRSIDIVTEVGDMKKKLLGWRSMEFGVVTLLFRPGARPGSGLLSNRSYHRKYKVNVSQEGKLEQLIEALSPKIQEMASNIEAIKTQHKQGA